MTSQTFHVKSHQYTANLAGSDLNHVCCAMGKEKQRDLLIHSDICVQWTNTRLAHTTFWKSTKPQAFLLNSSNQKCRNTGGEIVLQHDEQLTHLLLQEVCAGRTVMSPADSV